MGDSNPCQNGGECTDGDRTYSCKCADGFTGGDCSEAVEVNECDSNPCQNGGECTDGDGTYTCDCADGFTGGDCSEEVPEPKEECEDRPADAKWKPIGCFQDGTEKGPSFDIKVTVPGGAGKMSLQKCKAKCMQNKKHY